MTKILGFGVNKSETQPTETVFSQKPYTGNNSLKQLEKDTVSFGNNAQTVTTKVRKNFLRPAQNAQKVQEDAFTRAAAWVKAFRENKKSPVVRVGETPVEIAEKTKPAARKDTIRFADPIGNPVPKEIRKDIDPDKIDDFFNNKVIKTPQQKIGNPVPEKIRQDIDPDKLVDRFFPAAE